MLKKDEIIHVLVDLGLPYHEAVEATERPDLLRQGIEELVCRKSLQVINIAHAALGMAVPVNARLRWDGK